MSNFEKALQIFQTHYSKRLGPLEHTIKTSNQIEAYHYWENERLKPQNGPSILYHSRPTQKVIILTHGLSDSPYYVLAIAKRFYLAGYNVIITLLPAHGLKVPEPAIRAKNLLQQWKATIDNAVEVAQQIGGNISIGGFSTGATLGLNKILRNSNQIKGALFMVSGALDVGRFANWVVRLPFLKQLIRRTEASIPGYCPELYRYPHIPKYAALELVQLIRENKQLLVGRKINQAVVALHSYHDTTAFSRGVHQFMTNHVKKGNAILLSEAIKHEHLPLEEPIPLDETIPGPIYTVKANPHFDWMMTSALQFLERNQ